MKEFYSNLIVVHKHLQTLYDGAKKDIIEIGEIKERLDRIESVLNKHLFSDEIIITGKSPLDPLPLTPGKSTDVPIDVEFIDIYNQPEDQATDLRKVVEDKPEIIGDYMHWQGEDYYRITEEKEDNCSGCFFHNDLCCKYSLDEIFECPKSSKIWKNIKTIDITDELAKLRPYVKYAGSSEGNIDVLYGVREDQCIIYDLTNNWIGQLEKGKYTIATTADLKKAEITE